MVFGIFSSGSRSDVSSDDDNHENATIESESSSDDTRTQKKRSILRRKYGRNSVDLTPKEFERKVSWSHTIESRRDYHHHAKKGDESTTFESIADTDRRSIGESRTEIDSVLFSSATTTSSARSSCTSHDDDATSASSASSTSDQMTSYSQGDDDNTSAVVVDDSLRSVITSESSNSIEVEHKVPTPPPPPMMGPTLTERKKLQYRSNLLCASISISEATFDKYKGTAGNDDDDDDDDEDEEDEENDMQVGNGRMTNIDLPIMQPTPTMSAYKKAFLGKTMPPPISTKRQSTAERMGEGGIDLPLLQPTPTMSAYKKVLLEIVPPILSNKRQSADRGGCNNNNNEEAVLTPSSIFIPPEQIDLPDELPNSPSNLTIQSNWSISSSMDEPSFGDNEKGEEREGGGENTSHHRLRASSDDTSLRTTTKGIGNYGAIFNIQKQADKLAGHIGLILGTNKWNWFDTTLETTQSTTKKENISLVSQKESNVSILKSKVDEASDSQSKSEAGDSEELIEEDEASERLSKSEDVDSEELTAAIKAQSTDLSNQSINENDIVKTDENDVSNENRCEKDKTLSYQKKTYSSSDEYEAKNDDENTSQNSRNKPRVKDAPLLLDDELYNNSPNGSDLSDGIITQIESNEGIFDEMLDFTRTRSKTIGTQTAGVDILSKQVVASMDQIPMNVMEKKNHNRKQESRKQWFWGWKKSTKSEEQITPCSVPETPFTSFGDRFTPRQLPDGRVHDADNDCMSSCVSADTILVELKLIEDTAKVMYQQIILGESSDMGLISALILPEEETELVLEKGREARDEETYKQSTVHKQLQQQKQQQHCAHQQEEENTKVSGNGKNKGGKISKFFGRKSRR